MGHHNIISYTNRPFKDVRHMNGILIKNWNAKVKAEDQVFHVGDFCFKNSPGGKKGEGLTYKASYYEEQLNGKKIDILGNHDRNNGVKSLIQKLIIKYGHHHICLVHDPENYDPEFAINFVGHVHDRWKFKRIYNPFYDRNIDLINVGVDVWNFFPVTFEEIYKEYKRWGRKGYPNIEHGVKQSKTRN